MVFKLLCAAATGSPRKASFAPSSMMTWLGLCSVNNAAKRERPPAVVSPLMLAFTILKFVNNLMLFWPVAGVLIA